MNPFPDLHLSPRQWEVALAVASGLTVAEIARDLLITEHTVQVHAAAVRDRIVKRFAGTIPAGRPRPVILKYYALVERRAFSTPDEQAA